MPPRFKNLIIKSDFDSIYKLISDYLKLSKASDLTNKKDRFIYRFFEILPGALAWGTLITVILLSFLAPVYIAIFIIIFDVYWFVKTVYLSLHLRVSFAQVRKNMTISWLEELKKLQIKNYKLPGLSLWQDIYHLILLPTYKEGSEVISAALDGLINANYPKDKMIIVIGQEERAGKDLNNVVRHEISSKFSGKFMRLEFVEHPANITGELAGKGSNIAWAAKYATREIIDKLGISYEQVLVSAFDVDTVVFPEYFGRLTYVYLTAKNPLRSFYQPVPFYTNNIWYAPSFARVVAFSASFWHIIKQEMIETDTSFSSHTEPLKALVDVDFWQTNMVSEDSRIFWQCFFRYDGNYVGEALFYPVSMDANVAHGFWQTMINVYKQQRRWGYGVENVPYLMFNFYKNKVIPWWRKFIISARMLERFWSWATNALLIFFLGWLPVVVGGPEFNQTVLSFNLPRLTRVIMTVAMLGLVTSAVFSIIILPPRPPKYGKFRYLWMALQWLLFPITTIFLGSIPGLDAQTRLMLGKYMGFWVTPKARIVKREA